LNHDPIKPQKVLGGMLVSGGAVATPSEASPPAVPKISGDQKQSTSLPFPSLPEVDFRYAPRLLQATICFPDDPKKPVVGQAGDLRYFFGHKLSVGMEDFATVSSFSLAGMQDDRLLRQWLEAPPTSRSFIP
jgi:hypothetical protein